MSADNLIQLTIRLEPVVRDALAQAARENGQEAADYTAEVLTKHVLDVGEVAPFVAARLRAEIEVKAWAIEKAREITEKDFDPHVTLKVFEAIDGDEDDIRAKYCEAIGGGDPYARGNRIKARINRALGAAIKTAVDANSKTIDGDPEKVQVSNKLIFSYTVLEPSARS
jgi:hypothetical protein